MTITGRVVQGCKHFRWRMTNFTEVFKGATGEELFPGTLNVKVESTERSPPRKILGSWALI